MLYLKVRVWLGFTYVCSLGLINCFCLGRFNPKSKLLDVIVQFSVWTSGNPPCHQAEQCLTDKISQENYDCVQKEESPVAAFLDQLRVKIQAKCCPSLLYAWARPQHIPLFSYNCGNTHQKCCHPLSSWYLRQSSWQSGC